MLSHGFEAVRQAASHSARGLHWPARARRLRSASRSRRSSPRRASRSARLSSIASIVRMERRSRSSAVRLSRRPAVSLPIAGPEFTRDNARSIRSSSQPSFPSPASKTVFANDTRSRPCQVTIRFLTRYLPGGAEASACAITKMNTGWSTRPQFALRCLARLMSSLRRRVAPIQARRRSGAVRASQREPVMAHPALPRRSWFGVRAPGFQCAGAPS